MKFLRSLFMRLMKSIISIIVLLLMSLAGIWCFLHKPWLEAADKQVPQVKVDPERMKEIVKLFSVRFHPRSYRDHVALLATGKTIQRRFETTKGKVEMQKFSVNIPDKGETVSKEYFNVSCLFGEGKGPLIIIGAHYDSHDMTPGADDNASGLAGLLELAYLLDAEKKLNCEIELVAYSLEEPPFFATDDMGSAHHANKLEKEGVEVRAVLILEMIGYFTEEANSQDYPTPLFKLLYPSVGNFIAIVGKLDQGKFTGEVKSAFMSVQGLGVQSINAPVEIPGIDFSDHRNYWAKGHQAVMITDTAFYRNKAYHTENDTWDRLNYEKMALVVEGTFNAVMKLSKKEPKVELNKEVKETPTKE
ncbi:predicted aminopeptidase [Lentisphaera araneosa HTCC2155]|uniref:Predicted aminopeptidase n=1 Tax=Lentisphaera araneosa HTCC2155 TaxID=313628 RepID=A6DF39_9BACT|nr:M28 family peptidase [Lentisphaera araneosa]EDM29419.1 predicted aminopeptidase [Lentisphaera araneosa HTCC2155]